MIRDRIDAKGETRIQIDLRFRRVDGVQERYRRYASVQTKAGAKSESDRVTAHFVQHGTIKALLEEPEEPKALTVGPTWDDAVRRFTTVTYVTGGRKGQGLRASTQRAYGVLLKSPAFQSLAGVVLTTIDREFIVAWEARHLSTIGASTRASYHVLLRSVLRAFLGDDVPKFPKLPKGQHHEVEATDPAVIEAILSEADDPGGDHYVGPIRVLQRQAMRLAMLVAISTGLRASELRALQWRDVDLQAGILTVRAGMIRGVRDLPKSGKPRQIPMLDPRLLDALQAEHQKRKPQQTDHVLLKADGRPWGDSGLGAAIRRAAGRLGLKMGAPLHPIRHRFVTEVAATDPVAAQRLAGHADLSTTMRYAHSSDVRERTAVQAALAGLRGVPGSQLVPRGTSPEGV